MVVRGPTFPSKEQVPLPEVHSRKHNTKPAASTVLSLQCLPPSHVLAARQIWGLWSQTESHGTYNILLSTGRWTTGHALKAPPELHPKKCLLPGRIQGPKPRLSELWFPSLPSTHRKVSFWAGPENTNKVHLQELHLAMCGLPGGLKPRAQACWITQFPQLPLPHREVSCWAVSENTEAHLWDQHHGMFAAQQDPSPDPLNHMTS
jgi:hypothetical protein